MSKGLFGLTSFQRDLLVVASGLSRPSGQTIKDEIEEIYDGNVTHGRLYPNLDTLANKGFVEKGSINRRTNYYEVSEQGKEALQAYREWEAARLTPELAST